MEEKKEMEYNNAKLKPEQKESNKNSSIPSTSDEGSEVVKMSGNEQQTAKENSEVGSATALSGQSNLKETEKTVIDNKDVKMKSEESNTRRSTRSTTANSQSNKVTGV